VLVGANIPVVGALKPNGAQMTATRDDAVLVWRASTPARIGSVVLAGLIAAVLLAAMVTNPVKAWFCCPALLVPVFLASSLWRGARLDDQQIVARGRLVRRVIPLTDLRQVGLSRIGFVWVQTHTPRPDGGDVTALRMAPRGGMNLGQGPPADQALVDEIRRRAARCGATLDPRVAGPVRPPTRKPLVFSI